MIRKLLEPVFGALDQSCLYKTSLFRWKDFLEKVTLVCIMFDILCFLESEQQKR